MIHWSILQPSEIASLFILAMIFLVFVTAVGVIRSGRRVNKPTCTLPQMASEQAPMPTSGPAAADALSSDGSLTL
jgi:hypothetical protein